MPQDHRAYLPKDGADKSLLSADLQADRQRQYNRLFFQPWHQGHTLFTREDAEGFFQNYLKKGENGKTAPRPKKAFLKALAKNARLTNYPNADLRAITIGHTDMRGLPTSRPFHSSKNGRPHRTPSFDRLQVSAIPPNTPVYIVHWSRDKKWCLAETGFAFGWIAARKLAFVNDSFIKTWETGSYVSFIHDGFPIGKKKHPFFESSLGSLFPKVGENEETLDIFVAVMGKNRRAVMKKWTVPKTVAATSPLALNRQNMAELANELMDNPYGWGGKDRLRDCSSMIRDLYAPFGLWLPRHSADQATQGGLYIDLSGKNREEKQAMIIAQGAPYLTLLWLKGHIMIYIGTRNGAPLVFHNFWSVRTTDDEGRSWKKIVGRTAITTLHPGREFQPSGSRQGDMLGAIQGMTLLTLPALSNTVLSNTVVKQTVF